MSVKDSTDGFEPKYESKVFFESFRGSVGLGVINIKLKHSRLPRKQPVSGRFECKGGADSTGFPLLQC